MSSGGLARLTGRTVRALQALRRQRVPTRLTEAKFARRLNCGEQVDPVMCAGLLAEMRDNWWCIQGRFGTPSN